VIKRATKDNVVYCEKCGLPAKKFEVDHVIPDALHTEDKQNSNDINNARLLCKPCHQAKTKSDVAEIARAKRREAKHLGLRKRPTLKSRGFEKVEKKSKSLSLPPRRSIYEDVS
jgi:5-methylcytosine-specific restriction endonuclease McrA